MLGLPGESHEDMLATARCDITPQDTGSSLHDKLMQLGAEALMQCLPDLLAGTLPAVQQPEAGACYAPKLSKQEAELDWTESAQQLERKVRAFNAWPVAFTGYQRKGSQESLRVWQAEVIAQAHAHTPGTVLRGDRQGIDVACGSDVLRLLQVQPAGKRVMQAAEFNNSHDLAGQVLHS